MRRFCEVVHEGFEASSWIILVHLNYMHHNGNIDRSKACGFLPPMRFSTLNPVSQYCLYFSFYFQYII